jgi:hypothetical protein
MMIITNKHGTRPAPLVLGVPVLYHLVQTYVLVVEPASAVICRARRSDAKMIRSAEKKAVMGIED